MATKQAPKRTIAAAPVHHQTAAAAEEEPETHSVLPEAVTEDNGENTLGSKLATVAVIGLGAALIEVELIPGMLIGAAAVLAPNFLPKLGNALRPMIKSTVKAGYAFAAKTKETMAEAGEQFQDIVAEAKAEAEPPAGHSTAARETA